MCFSIKVPRNNRQLEEYFNAKFSEKDAAKMENLFKQQAEMDEQKLEKLLGISHARKRPTPFKRPESDGRVFPGYFANVIIEDNNERILTPMRYRVRPEGSREEIPEKFGVYNARIDSLDNKQTWKPLFMRKHGLVPFTNFYEWVLDPEEKNDLGLFNLLDEEDRTKLGENTKARKRLISFYPGEREIMWAPCLWDEWQSENGEIAFKSFAIITDDPPKEVEIMGHDRCPVFIKEEYISEWLNPGTSSVEEIYEILKSREAVKFRYEWT